MNALFLNEDGDFDRIPLVISLATSFGIRRLVHEAQEDDSDELLELKRRYVEIAQATRGFDGDLVRDLLYNLHHKYSAADISVPDNTGSAEK